MAPTLTLRPTNGCPGDVIAVTGSGYIPNSAITITQVGGTMLNPYVFSEATTDAAGNVDGYFVVPEGHPTLTSEDIILTTAGGDVSDFVSFDFCCNRTHDGIALTGDRFVGPPFTAIVPYDYVHFDGAHWFVYADESVLDPTSTSTLPPPANHTLNLVRVSDDGTSTTTYPLDTGYVWGFQSGNVYIGCNNYSASLYFNGWSKPVYDVKLASDGTTLWAVVVTAESVPYPYLSKTDTHCGQLSQFDQFVDLATLTAGFTFFPTSSGAGFPRAFHNSIGTLGFYNSDFPNSDGGVEWFGYWNPPKIVVFAGDVGGFAKIGEVEAKYCSGGTSAVGNDSGGIGNPHFRFQEGPQANFFTEVSATADPAEPGVCHVIWAEGGSWGTCGDSAVWDANQPNQDYRVNYTRWGPGANLLDVDLLHSHIDRSTWWFPFMADFAPSVVVFACGYSWPTTADLVASPLHALRNAHGAPALFFNSLVTRIGPPPNGRGTTDPAGNPWLDNQPDFAPPTMNLYDLSGGGLALRQSLGAGLLPTLAELLPAYPGAIASNRFAFGLVGDFYGLGTPFETNGMMLSRGFGVSLLYDDPTLDGSAPVYLLALPWGTSLNPAAATGSNVSYPAYGIYRVEADGSAPFEILDGERLPGYSILIPGYSVAGGGNVNPTLGDFFSDIRNVWQPGATRFNQLDRICRRRWENETSTFPVTRPPARASRDSTGVYYDPATDALYYIASADTLGQIQVGKAALCRSCRPCRCGDSGGLNVSKRISFSKEA